MQCGNESTWTRTTGVLLASSGGWAGRAAPRVNRGNHHDSPRPTSRRFVPEISGRSLRSFEGWKIFILATSDLSEYFLKWDMDSLFVDDDEWKTWKCLYFRNVLKISWIQYLQTLIESWPFKSFYTELGPPCRAYPIRNHIRSYHQLQVTWADFCHAYSRL